MKKSLNPWRSLNPQSCIHIWGSCFSVAKEIFLLCLWHGMVPNLLFVLPSCLPHPPLIHHQWPLASAAFFATTDILHINLFKQANNCSSWANLTVIWTFWKNLSRNQCFATNRFAEKIQSFVSSARSIDQQHFWDDPELLRWSIPHPKSLQQTSAASRLASLLPFHIHYIHMSRSYKVIQDNLLPAHQPEDQNNGQIIRYRVFGGGVNIKMYKKEKVYC